MLDKLRSRLVQFGPSMLSVPVKLAPFALKRRAGTGTELAVPPRHRTVSWSFWKAAG